MGRARSHTALPQEQDMQQSRRLGCPADRVHVGSGGVICTARGLSDAGVLVPSLCTERDLVHAVETGFVQPIQHGGDELGMDVEGREVDGRVVGRSDFM